MSIQKRFLTSKGICRVTFSLPKSVVENVSKIAVVGDFNDWCTERNPMKKTKNGKYEGAIDLPLGKEYQFRYLIDDDKWENDMEADGMTTTPYKGTFNSVVKCDYP